MNLESFPCQLVTWDEAYRLAKDLAKVIKSSEVRFPLSVNVVGLKVLIIDDVTDTGETLRVAASYLKEKGAADIKTGVLQHKVGSIFKPDYFAVLIKEWGWIIYPWAAHEDLVGFAERVLSHEPLSKDQILSELERRFALVIGQEISEVLQDLVEMGKAKKRGDMYRRASKQIG